MISVVLQAVFPARCMFLFWGFREFPRATAAYTFLALHDEVFMPLLYYTSEHLQDSNSSKDLTLGVSNFILIRSTANQKPGKPLYIWQYFPLPSHRPLHIESTHSFFSIVCDKMIIQRFLTACYARDIPLITCIFYGVG